MDISVGPYLPVVTPTRRKGLPKPRGESPGLTPAEDAAAAVDSNGIGHRCFLLRLHVVQVLLIAFLDASKILENGLALPRARISVNGEVDGSAGSLSDCLRLGKTTPSIMLSLGSREVGHAGCIAFFKTTHNGEARIPECGYFGMSQVPQVTLDERDMPALILKAADALDNTGGVSGRFNTRGCRRGRARRCCRSARGSKRWPDQMIPNFDPFRYQLLLVWLQPATIAFRMPRSEDQVGKAIFVALPAPNRGLYCL
jgi:hypothetical protein